MLHQRLLVWDQPQAMVVARSESMKTNMKRPLYIAFVMFAALLMFAAPAFACFGSAAGSGGC